MFYRHPLSTAKDWRSVYRMSVVGDKRLSKVLSITIVEGNGFAQEISLCIVDCIGFEALCRKMLSTAIEFE